MFEGINARIVVRDHLDKPVELLTPDLHKLYRSLTTNPNKSIVHLKKIFIFLQENIKCPAADVGLIIKQLT